MSGFGNQVSHAIGQLPANMQQYVGGPAFSGMQRGNGDAARRQMPAAGLHYGGYTGMGQIRPMPPQMPRQAMMMPQGLLVDPRLRGIR